ncbi:MAG: glycosyltransferase family 4 protein [Patescibacteria group bacterium]|nr:glycosyltransferase family 4 protein [Patescibacteria group bacterium]
MNIGINGYETVISRFGQEQKTGLVKRTGSSEYVFKLLQNLYQISLQDTSNQFSIFLPDKPGPDLPTETATWKYVVVPKKSIWTLIDLSWYFLSHKLDLDFFISPTHYLPIYCPYPAIISVMDLSYLHFPELFRSKDLWQLKLWTRFSVNKAKRVLTISQASKNDIIKEYGVDKDKVQVTYPGIKDKRLYSSSQARSLKVSSRLSAPNNKSLDMNKILEKYHIKKPYILFVGTIQPRKNIARLVEAFSLLCHSESASERTRNLMQNKSVEKDPSTQPSASLGMTRTSLVIIGRPGWMYEEIYKSPKKYGVDDKVKFLDSVSEEDLPAFYQNALVFILPSLYEGFGLPILEAMQNGCPVITSSVSSMPEAGGEAALYVNPKDAKDIAEKISKVLSDEKLRNNMIVKGYQQVKKFSWEKTARETLKILEEVVNSKQ